MCWGPHCLNGGQCVDRIGGYTCRCLPGFAGERCEGDINECLSNPCSSEGSLDCVQLKNNYNCICRSAFTGRHCETFLDVCPQKPCLNGGTCAVASNMPDGFICRCPPGFSGARCQSSCGQVKCRRGEQCIHTDSGPRCFCLNPKDCESGCASNPCQHGGTCYPQRQPPHYSCRCPPSFGGSHCELYTAPTSTPPATCQSQYCADKARDGICDEACNSHACQWDGGDCSLTMEDPGPTAPPLFAAGNTSTTSVMSSATPQSACLTTLSARGIARRASMTNTVQTTSKTTTVIRDATARSVAGMGWTALRTSLRTWQRAP